MAEKNIWDAYGRWDDYAQLENIDDVRAKITGNRIWRPNFTSKELEYIFEYTFDEMLASNIRATPAAVDFGCGLGRNGPMLRRFFPRVIGVDLPELVARLSGDFALHMGRIYGAIYASVEDLVANEDFCVLYDSVVFQHIIDPEYVSNIIRLLSSKPSFRTFVSVYYGNLIPAALAASLQENGWQIWYSEPDILSFEETPHSLTVFRRR